VLAAAARFGAAGVSRPALALLVGLAPDGRALRNALSVLTDDKLLEVDRQITATAEGLTAAGAVPGPPDRHELLLRAREQASETGARILSALEHAGTDGMPRAALARAVGLEPDGRAFRNALSALKRNQTASAPSGRPVTLGPAVTGASPTMRRSRSRSAASGTPPSPGGDGQLSKGAAGFLEILAKHHPLRFTAEQLITLAGRGRRSSAIAPQLAEIVDGGYATKDPGGRYGATDDGVSFVGLTPRRRPRGDRVAMWTDALPRAAGAFAAHLASVFPQPISDEDLATATGYSPTSSAVSGALSLLRANDLVVRVDGGNIATEELVGPGRRRRAAA
jgi:hypothetical protein